MTTLATLEPGRCPDFLKETIVRQVAQALAEDAVDNDLSVIAIDKDAIATARVISREAGILAGVFWFEETFAQVGPTSQIRWLLRDGDKLGKGATLCTVHGNARNMLKGERCALNFLQTLSGTATRTAEFVAQAQRKITVKDTRKTLPGLRLAQKYAVVCGGGTNHRVNLADAILLKDNHIQACGSITAALQATRCAMPGTEIEVEVSTLAQVEAALAGKADVIMLDNFSSDQRARAIATIAGKAKVEISGGVDLDDVPDLATSGADYISVGALTKHVRALDLSMQFTTTPTELTDIQGRPCTTDLHNRKTRHKA